MQIDIIIKYSAQLPNTEDLLLEEKLVSDVLKNTSNVIIGYYLNF